MSLWSGRPFVSVRILGPLGSYPSYEVRTSKHIYVPSQACTWSAVLQPPVPDDWEHGETVELVPEEVRLFAAITLSEPDPWANGRPVITHWTRTSFVVEEGADLTSSEVRDQIEAAVQRLRSDSHPRIRSASQPAESPQYHFLDVGSVAHTLDILECIDASDQLLLAGLARLLGGTRVMFAAHELEEASFPLFVAMSAGLEFIRQHLELNSPGASYDQVFSYLDAVYPEGSQVGDYYRYMYDHRLAAMHPSNRDGEFWAPPLMADDVYHLQKHLVVLFRHIVLGEPPALAAE